MDDGTPGEKKKEVKKRRSSWRRSDGMWKTVTYASKMPGWGHSVVLDGEVSYYEWPWDHRPPVVGDRVLVVEGEIVGLAPERTRKRKVI